MFKETERELKETKDPRREQKNIYLKNQDSRKKKDKNKEKQKKKQVKENKRKMG